MVDESIPIALGRKFLINRPFFGDFPWTFLGFLEKLTLNKTWPQNAANIPRPNHFGNWLMERVSQTHLLGKENAYPLDTLEKLVKTKQRILSLKRKFPFLGPHVGVSFYCLSIYKGILEQVKIANKCAEVHTIEINGLPGTGKRVIKSCLEAGISYLSKNSKKIIVKVQGRNDGEVEKKPDIVTTPLFMRPEDIIPITQKFLFDQKIKLSTGDYRAICHYFLDRLQSYRRRVISGEISSKEFKKNRFSMEHNVRGFLEQLKRIFFLKKTGSPYLDWPFYALAKEGQLPLWSKAKFIHSLKWPVRDFREKLDLEVGVKIETMNRAAKYLGQSNDNFKKLLKKFPKKGLKKKNSGNNRVYFIKSELEDWWVKKLGRSRECFTSEALKS